MTFDKKFILEVSSETMVKDFAKRNLYIVDSESNNRMKIFL